jgi:hypothetical protein
LCEVFLIQIQLVIKYASDIDEMEFLPREKNLGGEIEERIVEIEYGRLPSLLKNEIVVVLLETETAILYVVPDKASCTHDGNVISLW